MSYILDALRKSDEERTENGGKPMRSGMSFKSRGSSYKKRSNAFGLILVSFMLVGAVILGSGWWWSQRDLAQTEEAARLEQPLPATPEKEPLTPPAETQEPAEPDPAPLPGAEGGETVSGAQPSRTPAAVPHLSEMSVEFQAGLPDLRFSGHVYSPVPELRMILINDSVVREGQQIDTGLTLFEITETGVILRAGQTLFQIELL